jgi:hypothetical protein
MAQLITEEDLEGFLKLCHGSYLSVPPMEDSHTSLGHVFSILIPDESALDPVSILQLSRRFPLKAAIDINGHGVGIPIRDTNFMLFAFAPKDEDNDVNRQLEEMTLPRGSLAFGLSYENFVVMADSHGSDSGPIRVRQTYVIAPGGRMNSFITLPDSTIQANGFFGKTVALLHDVVERIPTD